MGSHSSSRRSSTSHSNSSSRSSRSINSSDKGAYFGSINTEDQNSSANSEDGFIIKEDIINILDEEILSPILNANDENDEESGDASNLNTIDENDEESSVVSDKIETENLKKEKDTNTNIKESKANVDSSPEKEKKNDDSSSQENNKSKKDKKGKDTPQEKVIQTKQNKLTKITQ